MKKYVCLLETTNVIPNSKLDILEEQKANDVRKVRVKAFLQEADVRNGNGRVYPLNICESIVSQLKPKAESRNLLMEVGHPLVSTSDPVVMRSRVSTTDLNNCGAVLTDLSLDGYKITGVFETLSAFKGPDLYKLIMYDHVDIGFSLRAFGSVEIGNDGTMVVKEPIKPITYDVVPNPSYQAARVLEFIPEQLARDIDNNAQVLTESQVDTVLFEMDNINYDFTASQKVMTEFLKEVLQEQVTNFLKRCVKISF